jgi:hypothetical protein
MNSIDNKGDIMALTSKMIELLKLVIVAAEDGRFCHGNGATWVIVDKSNREMVITIDHTRESMEKMSPEASKKYLAGTPAHKSQSTADSLKNFIKQ